MKWKLSRIKIFGGPGTGKTKTLQRILSSALGVLSEPEKEILELLNIPLPPETRPERTCFLTYQNSALEEFLIRRLHRDPVADRRLGAPFRYYRTIHGLCLVLLLEHGIVQRSALGNVSPIVYFADFCRRHGLRFEPNSFGVHYAGNRLWRAYSSIFNKYYANRSANEIIAMLDMEERLGYYARLWERYKRRKGVIDYVDMLRLAFDHIDELCLDVDVVLADECQDFSALQYAIFQRLTKGVDYVCLAGDDWQTIFSFHGASPRFLLSFPGKQIILPITYRLPTRLLGFALSFAKRHLTDCVYKPIRAARQGGRLGHVVFFNANTDFDRLSQLAQKAAQKGTVFVLTRTNKQAWALRYAFASDGLLVRPLKDEAWAQHYLGKSLGDVAKAYIEGKPPKFFDSPQKVAKRFGVQGARLLSLLVQARRCVEMNNLFVDTIHAAKGREADYVFVYNRMHTARWRRYVDAKDEARVWFVAITRARKQLVILSSPPSFPLGDLP